ncbi:BON domain-containing protein [Candidatus Binatus sp.]|jgi:osmotically-inducible protein OsmY|uniref:BON domain-containing protein n=1 Tax=Candidatus Binatus sp. TaxID=2811406 RepID=UPI003CAE3A04
MELNRIKIVSMMLLCGLATVSMSVSNSHAQQGMSDNAPGAATGAPAGTTDQSLTVEHDKVQTSAEHIYNSPAERANDDLVITEVKRSLAELGISDRYPVEVDCDHGTVQLSGVVASAEEARQAESIAMNTPGVVGVKNKLTWR